MKSLLLLLLHLGIYLSMYSQTLTLNPSYQSIGICITDIGNADSCKIEYKKQSSTKWVTGFSPDKIILSGSSQFRGSLFLLEESTKYDVQLTIYTTGIASKLPISTTSTLSSPNFKAGNNIKWVSPNGKGNLYTEENPGNITTLFSSGLVECGTTIFLTNGVFTQNGLNLNITTNCTEATPICIMAAPGAKPIVDGGISTALVWKQHPSDSKLFSAAIPSTAAYSTLCILDNAALYAYPSLTPKTFLGGYNLSALNFGYDGFVRDGNTIWIKTNAGINPNTSSVTLSTAFCFLTVYGKNNNAYLKVKGIEFKHFGKPILNAGGAYSATVFDIRNAHFVYFDSCKFLYNTSNISFSSQCNNLFIQNSTFKHDVGKWSHAMIKKSLFYVHNFLNSIATSRGRAIEEAAIFSDLGKNITVRYNIFDGMNSGIAGSYDRGLNEDVDIYENTFVDNFDAIECDGYWTNLRVWKNEIIRPMAGISAAPPLIGPRYFYRNVFYGMKGRRNERYDPHFIGCYPVSSNYKGQAVGIKTNSGYAGKGIRGNLYFFNNTFFSSDTLGFVFTSWAGEWKKAVFINNIFAHENSYPIFYVNIANSPINSNFQIHSVTDDYFTYNPNSVIIKAKHIHGQYNCTEVNSVDILQSTLTKLSGSPNILIQNPLQTNPNFNLTKNNMFELNNNSSLINAGTIIPGFYDYQGSKPDIGAKEKIVMQKN